MLRPVLIALTIIVAFIEKLSPSVVLKSSVTFERPQGQVVSQPPAEHVTGALTIHRQVG
jgi:hypothetical protein